MSIRSFITRRDRLVLESTPLHTESPGWAAEAPAQVTAMCQRRPHVGGLTEIHGQIGPELKAVADAHDYQWVSNPETKAHNTALLVQRGIEIVNHSFVVVENECRTSVTILFCGSTVTIYQLHWSTGRAASTRETASLITAMSETSQGTGLSFYMGDCNPDRPQHVPGSEPVTMLSKHSMPSIYEELGNYPPEIGVNVIGRHKADTRVKAVRVRTHPALGSDHIPVTGTYSIRKRRHHS